VKADCKCEQDSYLFRSSNPHINDSLFLEENKNAKDYEANLDCLEAFSI